MKTARVTARFPDEASLEAALCDLRRLGAVECAPTLLRPMGAGPVLRCTVRSPAASMTRAAIRRAGGRLSP